MPLRGRSRRSGLRGAPTTGSPASRPARWHGSRSRVRSPPSRRCSSSTNRPRASTRPTRGSSPTCSPTSPTSSTPPSSARLTIRPSSSTQTTSCRSIARPELLDSVPQVKITAEAARRFLVQRQLLAPARALDGGPEGVLEVFRRLGSIQFDPIAVAGRNHDLVLHARVAGYDPAWCELLYERRALFEAYNKGLSLVPTSDFPWFRANVSTNYPRILAEHADVAEQVLERIRADGPLSALDFERRRGPLVDWFGAPTNVVRAVLEAYAFTGVLGLARRDGNRRYYDLIERLLPPKSSTGRSRSGNSFGTSSCRG